MQGLDYSEQAYAVKIEPWSEKRRTKQNALSFVWYGERAAFFHTSVPYQHDFCKLHYAAPILAVQDQEFADVYENTILMLPYEVQMELIHQIPVTSCLNVKPMANYLTELERQSAEQGCILSRPDDSYWESMGVKK